MLRVVGVNPPLELNVTEHLANERSLRGLWITLRCQYRSLGELVSCRARCISAQEAIVSESDRQHSIAFRSPLEPQEVQRRHARDALVRPLPESTVVLDPGLAERVVEEVKGYPYFLQLWGASFGMLLT
jgi:hypothetical protein